MELFHKMRSCSSVRLRTKLVAILSKNLHSLQEVSKDILDRRKIPTVLLLVVKSHGSTQCTSIQAFTSVQAFNSHSLNLHFVQKITVVLPRIQEHVQPMYDLTMLNSAVSSAQHQITSRYLTFKNMYYLCLI